MSTSTRETIMSILYKRAPEVTLCEYEVALLNSLPPAESIPMLLAIFEQEADDRAQSRAFEAILAIEEFDIVKFLLDLLAQPSTDWRSSDWRLAYCEALSRFHDSRAIATLCKHLLEDPDPDMRYVAAESLGIIGDETAIEALEIARKNDKGRDFEGFPISKMAGKALRQIRSRNNR